MKIVDGYAFDLMVVTRKVVAFLGHVHNCHQDIFQRHCSQLLFLHSCLQLFLIISATMPNDQHRVIGSTIYALAVHAMNLADTMWLYGANVKKID